MAPIPEADGDSQDRQPTEDNNHEIEDVESPNFVINVVSEDSASEEEGDNENNGYQLLPQGELDDDNSDDDDEDEGEGEGEEDPDGAQGSEAVSVKDSVGGETTVEGVSSAESEVEGPVSQVNPGLIHQLRNQNFPHCLSKNVPSYMKVPDFPRPEKRDLLWNQERGGAHNSEMNQDHIEKIKSAMSSIQLPVAQIPDWAKNMSDEEWRKKLVVKLQDSSSQCSYMDASCPSSLSTTGSNSKGKDGDS
ncbi:hypothetical protein ScPMuIL_014533 [Solemya velum]